MVIQRGTGRKADINKTYLLQKIFSAGGAWLPL